ncbi:LysR family transcriptional regulator [Rhizobium alvei]|uniref:LysR family transcriptional regulator n=1 Tax=Rhizobium alvei TaxID=1132659 RepID=A0ABT8YQ83_9HYPH|nr:LysR family transcriptional regulator [Rhizobium alvei]MDO6965893.1 LysR family transcriptional regulator [Rhizobium alvei]
MDTLLSLRVLDAVAELKSFVGAAERLEMSPAMATKHVKHIEARLKARLLNRTSRSVSLTEAGSIYLQRMRPLLEGLDEAEAQISQTGVRPSGRLRVSLPVWMATVSFASLVTRYGEQYPDVVLELDFSARQIGLVEEGFDLAIRVAMSLEPGLIARKLGLVQFKMVASPAFLEKHEPPETIEALENSPFLAYSQVSRDGHLRLPFGEGHAEVQFKPVLISSNEAFLMQCACEGMGYTILPQWLVDGELAAGHLVHVLGNEVRPAAPLHAVYPDRSFMPAKLRSFLDFLVSAGFPEKMS